MGWLLKTNMVASEESWKLQENFGRLQEERKKKQEEEQEDSLQEPNKIQDQVFHQV